MKAKDMKDLAEALEALGWETESIEEDPRYLDGHSAYRDLNQIRVYAQRPKKPKEIA